MFITAEKIIFAPAKQITVYQTLYISV